MKKFLFLANALILCFLGQSQTTNQKADTIQFIRITNSLRAGSCSSPDGVVTEGVISSSSDPDCYPVATAFGGGSGSVTYCFSFTAPTGTNVGMDFACFYSHTCNSLSWTNAVLYNSPSCTVVTNPAPLDIFNPGEFTPGANYVFCYTITKSGGGGCSLTTFCPYFETFTVAPISISEFKVVPAGSRNAIYWSTSSEANNQWQIVERSLDGIHDWYEVDKVQGSMHSASVKTYEVMDRNPPQLAFYRIKSVDYDNKTQLSSIVAVKRNDIKAWSVSLSPNPTSGDVHIQMAASACATVINVFNNQGMLVLEKTEPPMVDGAIQQVSLETSLLPAGVYSISVHNGNQKSVERFVKL